MIAGDAALVAESTDQLQYIEIELEKFMLKQYFRSVLTRRHFFRDTQSGDKSSGGHFVPEHFNQWTPYPATF